MDDLGGIAHRMAHLLVFRGLDGTVKQLGSPLFPLSYLFWGCGTDPLPPCRRCAEVNQLLCCSAACGLLVAGADCVDIIVVAWCGMMSWVESCDEPYGFHIKDALSRLSAFRGMGLGAK